MKEVWVLSANAPDDQGVRDVYVSPKAAQAANPEGEWREEGGSWFVSKPVADNLYGGTLERFEVIGESA